MTLHYSGQFSNKSIKAVVHNLHEISHILSLGATNSPNVSLSVPARTFLMDADVIVG